MITKLLQIRLNRDWGKRPNRVTHADMFGFVAEFIDARQGICLGGQFIYSVVKTIVCHADQLVQRILRICQPVNAW